MTVCKTTRDVIHNNTCETETIDFVIQSLYKRLKCTYFISDLYVEPSNNVKLFLDQYHHTELFFHTF